MKTTDLNNHRSVAARTPEPESPLAIIAEMDSCGFFTGNGTFGLEKRDRLIAAINSQQNATPASPAEVHQDNEQQLRHALQSLYDLAKDPAGSTYTLKEIFGTFQNGAGTPELEGRTALAALFRSIDQPKPAKTSEQAALKAIDALTCNCPCMSLQAQHEFDRSPDATAYKVALAGVILQIRELARAAIQ